MAKNNADKFLGTRVKDKITGLEGICTGYCQYLTGCHQVLIIPASKDDKPSEGGWFDEQRIEILNSGSKIQLDNTETPGCDMAAPVR